MKNVYAHISIVNLNRETRTFTEIGASATPTKNDQTADGLLRGGYFRSALFGTTAEKRARSCIIY